MATNNLPASIDDFMSVMQVVRDLGYINDIGDVDRLTDIYKWMVDQGLASETDPGDLNRLPQDKASELIIAVSAYTHKTIKMRIPGSDHFSYNKEITLRTVQPILGLGQHKGNIPAPTILTNGNNLTPEIAALMCQYLHFGVRGHPM